MTKRTPEQNSAAWQRFKAKNLDRVREIRREAARRFRSAHPDRVRATVDAWRAANVERVRTTGRAQVQAWRDANREHFRVANRGYQSARRARKFANGGSHTEQEWREKIELFAGCCAYCGLAKPLTRDHKTPLAHGGTDDIANIIPACNSCNASKQNRTAREFIAARMAA